MVEQRLGNVGKKGAKDNKCSNQARRSQENDRIAFQQKPTFESFDNGEVPLANVVSVTPHSALNW
jgi:hypothetical protein